MKILKPIIAALGVLMMLSGLLWAGQGAGIIRWPASSFMVANSVWITYGLVTAAVGALLLWWGRRRAV